MMGGLECGIEIRLVIDDRRVEASCECTQGQLAGILIIDSVGTERDEMHIPLVSNAKIKQTVGLPVGEMSRALDLTEL